MNKDKAEKTMTSKMFRIKKVRKNDVSIGLPVMDRTIPKIPYDNPKAVISDTHKAINLLDK